MGAYLIEMFGVSLAVTIGAELAVAYGMLRSTDAEKESRAASWKTLVVLVNVLTNPPAVLLCWLGRVYLPMALHISVQVAVEAAVIAAEAYIYARFAGRPMWGIKKPVKLSVAANGCSWLLGMLLTAVWR